MIGKESPVTNQITLTDVHTNYNTLHIELHVERIQVFPKST
jgi:hypothetical protein